MSESLDEIRAWFDSRGIGLILSETVGAGKVYAHIYGGHPHQLKAFIVGDSMTDAARKAKEAVETGGALAVGLDVSASASSSAEATVSTTVFAADSVEISDRATVHPADPNPPVAPPAEPPVELLDTLTRVLKWQRTDKQDKVWMVQAYDAKGQLLGMGLGDDREDALLELSDYLMPDDESS